MRVMTSPFADASVEIIADFSKFDADFSRKLRARMKDATAGAAKEFDQLGTAAKRAGDSVTRNMRAAGESVRTSLAGGARTASRDLDRVAVSARAVSRTVQTSLTGVADRVRAAFTRAATSVQTSFRAAGAGAARDLNQVTVAARRASDSIVAAFAAVAARIRELFARIGETLRAAFGPGLARVFDPLVDAARFASVRISTDLPAAAERVRAVFGSVFGTGPAGVRGMLGAVGDDSETAGRRVTGSMRAAADGAGESFGAMRDAAAGIFAGLSSGSLSSSEDVDVNLGRMKDQGAVHFGDISQSAELSATETVAAFRAAGAGISRALSVGNPFQSLTARAVVASQVIQRSMQAAALNVRRSIAQASGGAAREFAQISRAAQLAATRISAAMRAAADDVRRAFRQQAVNPFAALIAHARNATREIIGRFRVASERVRDSLTVGEDPFAALVEFARRAADAIADHFRNMGRDIAREMEPVPNPFAQAVTDAKNAARDIEGVFRNVGRKVAGDLGAGVEDPFNVITSRAADAARDIESQFDGLGRRISRDVNPPGDPFDGLRRQSGAAARDINSDMGGVARSIATVGIVAGGVAAAGGGIGLLAGGLASLAGAAAGVTAALTPMAGAILALPAAGAAGLTAVGTLKLGLSGMSDVLDSLTKDKPKDFEKALAKMSGSTRAFALELRKLEPAVQRVRKAVESELFAGMVPVLNNVTRNLLPVLRAGLVAMAGVFNDLAKNLGGFLSNPATASALRDVLADAATAMGSLAQAAVPAAKAILGLVQAGGPGVLRIADAVRVMAERFADFVAEGVKSGEIAKIIDDGITALGQLIDITKDFGGIIAGIFKAAGGDAKTLLSDIAGVVESMRSLVESTEGQSALHDFFEGVREIIAVTLPVFYQLAPIVGTVSKMIAGLVKGMGSGLQSGLAALGRGLESLLPAAEPIGQALGSIFEALGRIAESLGPALAEFLIEAAPYIDEMATITADVLVPLVRELTPLIGPMVRALGEMALAFLYIVEVIGVVRRPLTELFVNILIPILKDVEDLARIIKEPFKALSELLFFTDWDEILAPFKKAWDHDIPGTFLNAVTNARKFGPDLISGISQGIDERLAELRETAARIGRVIIERLKEILGIESPSTVMAGVGSDAIAGLVAGLAGGPARVKSKLDEIGRKFGEWAREIPPLMFRIGELIIDGLIQGLLDRANNRLRSAIDRITRLIPDTVSRLLEEKSPSQVMARIGARAVDGLEAGLLSGTGRIRAAMESLSAEVARDLGAPVIGAPVVPVPVITPAAVAAAAAVVPAAAPVAPVVPAQRAAPVVAAGALTPSALAPAGAGLTVVNNIALPTGDPQAAAQAVLNRIVADVLAGGG